MNLEVFPSSEAGKRMMNSISDDFYENSYVGKWLFQVMGLEMEAVREIVEELPYQAFPETATWGLKYHEQKYNLPIRENLTDKERRRYILQKRDTNTPMTPYNMEVYIKNITGKKVHVCDIHDPGNFGFVFLHPNTFKVVFVGDGVDTFWIDQTKELLDKKLKQSHTSYEIIVESPIVGRIYVGGFIQEADIISIRQVI